MIVFGSFLRAVYDRDILIPWVEHYLKYHFDRYHIILHDVKGEESFTHDTMCYLMSRGFEVSTIKGDYANGELQRVALSNLRMSLHAADYMVVADSDEFHDMPLSYCSTILKNEMIRGTMIDRWSESGLEAYHPIRGDISAQYPMKGFLWEHMADRGHIRKDALLDLPKTKLMAFRAVYNVNCNGCHTITDYIIPVVSVDKQIIDHYTWRPGILKRLAGKSYFHSSHISKVLEYFGVSPFSSEVDEVKMILEDRFLKTDALIRAL